VRPTADVRISQPASQPSLSTSEARQAADRQQATGSNGVLKTEKDPACLRVAGVPVPGAVAPMQASRSVVAGPPIDVRAPRGVGCPRAEGLQLGLGWGMVRPARERKRKGWEAGRVCSWGLVGVRS
jgi:hypothetical protein